MRLAPWLCLAAAVATCGCRERRAAPADEVARRVPAADVAGADAVPSSPLPPPEVPPEVPAPADNLEDPVPDAADPWVAFADGTVRGAFADGDRDLTEGRAVLPGTIVWTGEFSHAEFDFPDGSIVDLDEMTEVLLQKVSAAGGLRRIEIVLLDGAARFAVAPSPEAGSAFVVSTPVGTLETESGQISVEVDLDGGATRVVALAGVVVAHSGSTERTVRGQGSNPGALHLPSIGQLRDAMPWPELIERWVIWDEWQADRLLDRYDLDPTAPWTRELPALSPARHPVWAATLLVRRGRIEARARELTEALGAEAAAGMEPARLRARARDVLGPQVDLLRQQSALAAQRPARLERWRASERMRAERREAMRPRLARLRAGEPPGPPAE